MSTPRHTIHHDQHDFPAASDPSSGDPSVRQQQTEKKRRAEKLRRMRQQRRRRRIRRFLCVAATLILLAVILPWALPKATRLVSKGYHFVIGHLFGELQKDPAQESPDSKPVSALVQGSVSAEVLAQLRSQYKNAAQAQDILEHPERYPDALLELLAKRPETLDFVSGWPQRKDTPVAFDLTEQIQKGTIPLLYQWDLRWGYAAYGENIMALAGCGPTCLSMVALGLIGDADLHPVAIAQFSEEQGYHTSAGTSWELMTAGADQLGLSGKELPLDEAIMIRELEQGHPIICSVRPGDFTDTGHFIVLVSYADGAFTVQDPNSIDNSQKTWTYERIQGQIRNLWAFSQKSPAS